MSHVILQTFRVSHLPLLIKIHLPKHRMLMFTYKTAMSSSKQ